MAFAYITGTASNSGQTSSQTTTQINTTNATLLVVAVSFYYNPTGTVLLTDSANNKWCAVPVASSPSGTVNLQIFYCTNPTTSASHTFTATRNSAYLNLAVMAFSGGAAIYDKFATSSAISSSSGTTYNTGSITPSAAAIVITACATYPGGTTFTASGTTTLLNSAVGGYANIGLAYVLQSNPSAVNPGWTQNSNAGYAESVVSFVLTVSGVPSINQSTFIHPSR